MKASRLTAVLILSIAVVVAALFLIPMLWVVGGSFKNQFDIFKDVQPVSIWTFIPRHPTLANIQDSLFSGGSRTEEGGGLGLANAFLNSTIVSVVQVALTLILCSMAGYAFSRLRFIGRTGLFLVVLMALAVPLEVVVVPLYRVATELGLSNSLLGVLLPFVAQPLGLYILRQAFDDLPRQLDHPSITPPPSHLHIPPRLPTP